MDAYRITVFISVFALLCTTAPALLAGPPPAHASAKRSRSWQLCRRNWIAHQALKAQEPPATSWATPSRIRNARTFGFEWRLLTSTEDVTAGWRFRAHRQLYAG